MQSPIRIGSHLIGNAHRPFVIAEMSGNHNHSLDRALALVDAAAEAGAHALKLQTYTPDTMTLDLKEGEFYVGDPKSLWKGKSLYELYKEAYTPWEWHKPIFDRARQLGMEAFSTPFDDTSVEFLERLEVPCYKIASFENTDLPLIRRVARTGKPIILSTGMATLGELDETVRVAREAGCKELVVLKCTSAYPASPKNCNLNTLPHLRQLFGCEVGISDHTMGLAVPLVGIALGATVIEKHFTIRREDGGVDSAFSLEPEELAALVRETALAWESLGSVTYGPTPEEFGSLRFRRSLYIVKDLKAGETLTPDNLRAIRPGLGLAPKHLESLMGRRVREDVTRGTPASWSLLC